MARYAKSDVGERRTASLRLQLTPSERAELETGAAAAGTHLSQYVRELCLRRTAEAATVVAGAKRNPERRAPDARTDRHRQQPQPARPRRQHHQSAAPQLYELRLSAPGFSKPPWPASRAMIPRCKVGKGVTGAVRYILGEGRDPETGDPRKIWRRTRSAASTGSAAAVSASTIESREDADLARRIMEFDALNQTSRTRQCEKDCVHLSLGWRPGEQPTREQMEAAARDALKAIGMGNAKALFVGAQRRGLCARPYRRLQDQSRDRPRLRPQGQLPQALALGRARTSASTAAGSFAPAARKPTSCATRSTSATPAPCSS